MRRLPLVVGLILAFGCDDDDDAGFGDVAPRDAQSRDAIAVPDADALPADADPPDVAADAADLDAAADAGDVDGGAVCSTVCSPPPVAAPIPRAGLVLWLRSDLGVNIGPTDEACVWCDLSGQSNDMPARGAPVRLTTGPGGHPVVRTNGSDSFRRADVLAITSTQGRTLISVARLTDLDARVYPVGQGRLGTPGTYVHIDINTFNSTPRLFGAYVTNNAYRSSTPTSTTTAAVHVVRLETMEVGRPVLDELSYFIDGVEQTLTRTPGGLGNGLIETFDADFTDVGRGDADVDLSEVLIYDRPLSAPEREQVEVYLTQRYEL